MSISKQIILSSTLVGLLALFAGYTGWKNMHTIDSDVEQCMNHALKISGGLRGIQGNLMDIHKWFLATEKPEELSILLDDFDQNIAVIKELDENLDYQLSKISKSYYRLYEKHQNRPGNEFLDELRVVTFKGEAVLRTGHDSNAKVIKTQAFALKSNIENLSFWIITICLMIFVMAIVFGQVIARALSKSLMSLENAAAQIKFGDFSSRVKINAKNEFGYLANSFNLLAEGAQQTKIIEDQNFQLASLNQELKLKNDSLDSFVYRVSHDLKAPLINLISLQKIVKSKVQKMKDSELDRALNFMSANSTRLHQTIQDLLEVSKIERQLNKSKKWLSVPRLIKEIIEENNEDILKSDIQIDYDFKTEEIFYAKPNLKSVFSNLITNGIKYRKPTGANTLKIQTYSEGSMTYFKISDNGLGIDLEKHGKKLFGIFNRFHNHVEGSGVGLYIVKKIVEENGGQIKLESQVDQGTTFTISFPIPMEEQAKMASNILAQMNN